MKTKFLILFSLISLLVSAQSYNWEPSITTYFRHDYEAAERNLQICHASNHEMFFANAKGLLNFNGLKWTLFDMNHQSCNAVFEGSDGKIYVGTKGDFGYFEYSGNTLEYNSLKDGDETIKPHESIRKIIEHDGKILFQADTSVFSYDGSKVNLLFSDKQMESLMCVSGHLLLQRANFGLCKVIGDEFEILIPEDKIKDARIVSILINANGSMIVVTEKDGLFLFENKEYKQYLPTVTEYLRGKDITKAILTNLGELIVSTKQHFLCCFTSEGELLWEKNMLEQHNYNSINDIFYSHDGNLWLATDIGVYKFFTRRKYLNYPELRNIIGEINDMIYWNDNLILATEKGVYSLGLKPNTYEVKSVNKLINTDEEVLQVNALGHQLICRTKKEMFILENGDKSVIYAGESPTNDIVYFTKNDMTSMLAEVVNEGIVFYEKENGRWRIANIIREPMDSVSSMMIDLKNQMWLTDRKVIKKISFDENFSRFEKVVEFNENDVPIGIKGYQLEKFDEHVLIFNGLNVFMYLDYEKSIKLDEVLNSVPNLQNTRHVLSMRNRSTSCFLTDNQSCVVSLVNDSLRVHNLIIESTSLPIALCDLNGNDMILATRDQIYFYSSKHKGDDPRILLESVKAYSSDNRLLVYNQENMVFPNKTNNVSLDFSYPYYDNNKVNLWYKLEQEDEGYVLSNQGSINFHHLSPGHYVLKVQARDVEDNVLSEGLFEFSIKQPWYHSSWAHLWYVINLLVLILLVLFILKKYYELKDRREKNEQQIKMELEKAKNDSREKVEEMTLLSMQVMEWKNDLRAIKDEVQLQKTRLGNAYPQKYVARLNRMIDNLADEDDKDWNIFQENFYRLNSNFNKNIKAKHPSLTPKDLKLCALLYMNLDTKTIAKMLNISVRGVEIARYRLRTKMNLEKEQDLVEYLMQF